jgi:hypothetical protein
MKFSLIAFTASCALTTSAFAMNPSRTLLTDITGVNQPRLTDITGVNQPRFADITGVNQPRLQ